MARKAREQSSMGVYHAILRGVNKQQIFECNEDCESGFCSLQPVSSRISQGELLALVEELLPKEMALCREQLLLRGWIVQPMGFLRMILSESCKVLIINC